MGVVVPQEPPQVPAMSSLLDQVETIQNFMTDDEVSEDQKNLGEADKAKPEAMPMPLMDLPHLEDVSDATIETDSEEELGFEPIKTGSYLRSQSPGKIGAKYARLTTGANAVSPPWLHGSNVNHAYAI